MKLTRVIFFLLFIPFASTGQGVSMLPSELPKNLFGSWVDSKKNIVLIVSENYIVIQNELYFFNEIVQDNEVVNFTCVRNFDVKYIGITNFGTSNISLDEGYKISQLTKAKVSSTDKLPKTLLGSWFYNKEQVEILEDVVLYSGGSYLLDYAISTNNVNYYLVLYKEGEYYLAYNYINDEGQFLNTHFLNNNVFKKESFFHKHFKEFVSVGVLLLFILGFCLFRWKIALTKKKEVTKRKFTEMQLKSIRSQMNPHFLFNALSAIQNLINKGDSERANHYLTEFSQLMRLTLDKSEKGLVPLYDEIESIKKYLELERLRFSFNYEIILDPQINTNEIEIPAMLIQPLVENAIVHGLKEKNGDKKLTIKFKTEKQNLICLIADNGIGIEASEAKKNTHLKREPYGLKLAKDRIQLINENYNTNAKVHITDISNNSDETGTLVEIFMPLQY
ncbi:sensor histidine kinase [Mariniflexile gromovii]|uniref:Histidine kinase n=1 Tax=Mariniflexile gromovii TaxID=362523 RepID=A0ABS4BT35_9FLAO|nr:histidine kinase [Mariniflexile gromovii]MBP0903207.1 histidine kinase [Mariniflexile gromovii]